MRLPNRRCGAVLCTLGSMCLTAAGAVDGAAERSAAGMACTTPWDCADLDGDGTRDDPCVYWDCDAGSCSGLDTVFADMGVIMGFDCTGDGSADGADAFEAALCFAQPDYPCEVLAPQAANVDAGGRFGNCSPDGVCDMHDAYHAIFSFTGESTCACPASPAPSLAERPQAPASSGNGRRMYMARDGEEATAAADGNTAIVMQPGSIHEILVWMHDPAPTGTGVNGLQLLWPDSAEPMPGATGSITYVDGDEDFGGIGQGDSIHMDWERADWLYATHPVLGEFGDMFAVYAEHDSQSSFGLFIRLAGLTVEWNMAPGTYYLAQFSIMASPDASGTFILPFIRDAGPTPRPLSDVVDSGGFDYGIDHWQALEIRLPSQCVADCADADANAIRDDNCLWTTCIAAECASTPIVFADMGGQFGACEPDGTADSNDRFHALNCFANVDIMGNQNSYPCELHPNYPPTAYNTDAGGAFGSCLPDGVCDGHDAFHALNAFGDTSTCACPLDDGPKP